MKQAGSAPRWTTKVGYALSAVPVLAMAYGGTLKLIHNPELTTRVVSGFGYPEYAVTVIGILEIGSMLLYVFPRTAILGTILITGYLGGAVATHLRIGEIGGLVPALLCGIFAWGGVFLRDNRMRQLIPLLRSAS